MRTYDTEAKQMFYRLVMGGGDNNIHMGLFTGETDHTQIIQASQNTIAFDIQLMEVAAGGKLGRHSRILELGSATGGAAIELIKRFGCHVTGLNICPAQNAAAESSAQALGLSDKFCTVEASFDEKWPDNWTESYDAVFSIDSLVYSQHKGALMKQVSCVLKPGGVFAFSDLLATEGGTDEDRAALTRMLPGLSAATASHYITSMAAAGLTLAAYVDLSHHMGQTYCAMKHQIDKHYQELLTGGNTREHLDQYKASLEERIHLISIGRFSMDWGAFAAKKLPGSSGTSSTIVGALQQ